MEVIHYQLKEFLGNNETYQIVHREISPVRRVVMHDHDYYELFWVTRGSGYQIINKQRMPLEKGDLVMIRPQDAHMLVGDRDGMEIVNIAFSAATADMMHERYFKTANIYFWSPGLIPTKIRLDETHLHRFTDRSHEAMRHRLTYIQLDSLLLFIMRHLTNDESDDSTNIPIWLNYALNHFKTPDKFKAGRTGFANDCGRNMDYINRVVRTHFEMSLTDLLNTRKMLWAALQLSALDTPIKEICSDCGFNNLGHFYKVFKQYYGQTPQKYRASNQSMI